MNKILKGILIIVPCVYVICVLSFKMYMQNKVNYCISKGYEYLDSAIEYSSKEDYKKAVYFHNATRFCVSQAYYWDSVSHHSFTFGY